MGQKTDLRIREFQERADIEPATGKRAALLADMSKHAYDLIQVLALEASGIRDGDGHWHGSDRVCVIVNSLKALNQGYYEEINMKGNIWKVGDRDSGKGSHPLRLAHGHEWPGGATPPWESSLKAQDVKLDGCDCNQCNVGESDFIPF